MPISHRPPAPSRLICSRHSDLRGTRRHTSHLSYPTRPIVTPHTTHGHLSPHARMHTHTHTCTCTHACMHTHTHTHTHTHACTHTRTHAHTHTRTHATHHTRHTHTHTHMHTCLAPSRTFASSTTSTARTRLNILIIVRLPYSSLLRSVMRASLRRPPARRHRGHCAPASRSSPSASARSTRGACKTRRG